MKQTDQAQNDEDKPHQQGTCFISGLCSMNFGARLAPSQWYIKGSAKYPKLVVFISHMPTWAGCIPPDDNKIID